MLNLEITITGKTYYDLGLALAEIVKKVESECRGGSDSNEDGDYEYDITGEEENEIFENKQ